MGDLACVLAIALALGGGIALRIWVYRSTLGIPDSDEAIVGLMARHILNGELTTFFWGQSYGSSQEALLTAPLFAVFGSSWLALRIVPMLLSGVAALVVWRVGRRTVGETPARVAAAAYWIWPPFLVYKLTHQWGFYASAIVYGALVLLLALRAVERPSRSRVGLLALVVGLAIWDSIQLAPVLVAALAWTVWRQPRVLRHAWLALPLAAAGALPWLLWNVRHDWASFVSPISDTTTYQHRVRVFVSPLLPMLLGLRAPFSQEPVLGRLATDALYGALVLLFLYGAYRSRGRSVSLLYFVAAAYPFVYAVSPQTLFTQEPRYLLVLSPAIVVVVAQLVRGLATGVLLLVVLGGLSVVSLHRADVWARTVPPDPQIAPRDVQPLIRTLDGLGIRNVYATFWVAYRISFDSDERVVATQNKLQRLTFRSGRAYASRNPYNRWKAYERRVEADPDHGFVFFRRETKPDERVTRLRLRHELETHGYRRYVVGGFFVYAPPR